MTLKRLTVVDLSPGGWQARYLAAWARRRTGPGMAVLLHDPNSRGAGMDWGGAEVLRPGRLVPRQTRRDAQEWTHRVSLALAERRDLFPAPAGASLGRLALLGLQEYLESYALLGAAVREVVTHSRPAETVVLTTDRSVSAALASLVPGGVAGRGFSRPRWLTTLRRHAPAWPGRRREAPNGPETLPSRLARAGPRPRVLLIVESGPMAQMFAPIEQLLEARGVAERAVVDYAGSGEASLTVHGPRIRLALARPDGGPSRAPFRFAGQLESARTAARAAEADPRLGWLGGRVPLEYWLENMYLGEFVAIADQAERARQVVAGFRPDLLVVGNDRWWLGQSYVAAARAAGIPSLWVQDGTAMDSAVYFWMAADRLAAASDWLPSVLTRHGIVPERCRVTGQPRYDALIALAHSSDRAALRRRLGLAPEGRYALVATQPLQHAAYARDVTEALLAIAGLKVLLRPHPSQDHRALREMAAALPADRVSFHARDSIFDLLIACDLVVNQFSTVTLEAAIVGRPVITANFSGLPDPVPYGEFGLSTPARDLADIAPIARRMLEGHDPGATSEGLRMLVGPMDGRATERVVDLIGELLPPR